MWRRTPAVSNHVCIYVIFFRLFSGLCNYSNLLDSFKRLTPSTNGKDNNMNSLHTFSFIDLSELANFPKVQNNVFFRFKIRCIQNVGNWQKRRIKNMDELDKLGHGAEDCVQSLLQVEHKCYIRGALEFIRTQVMIFMFVCLSVLAIRFLDTEIPLLPHTFHDRQILAKDMFIIFAEPVDKALKFLSQDEKFLQKAYDLYHNASKFFSKQSFFLLGVIFRHYKIPFLYYM